MKKTLIWTVAIAALAMTLGGCSGEAQSKATDEEKANIDRFVREGIKDSDIGGGAAPAENKPPAGLPGNQPVSDP